MRRFVVSLSGFLILATMACEGLFGVDFDDVKPRRGSTDDAGESDADVRDASDGSASCTPSDDPKMGCGTESCAPCPTADHGSAACEGRRCELACDDGYFRCSSGCCPITEKPISAGIHHTCATTRAGALYCWGYNAFGQLGNQSHADSPIPVLVFGLTSDVRTSATGLDFTLAIGAENAVLAWGSNALGALGDGTTVPRATPGIVPVLGNDTRQIVATAFHACALSRSGYASCWGYNLSGVVGVDPKESKITTPRRLTQEEPFVDLATGSAHACGLGVSGTLYCWGANNSHQLGIMEDAGAFDQVTHPVRVPLSSKISALGLGYDHACVALENGTLQCWGSNSHGQLGVGDTDERVGIVDVLPAGSGVRQIALGDTFSCVLLSAGEVRCWGDLGTRLGVGDGSTKPAYYPVKVALDAPAAFVAAGANHVCVALLDGRMRCWGKNDFGQIGDGTEDDRLTPVDVTFTH